MEKIKKLVCDQLDKKDYLCHYRLLKFYIRMGMKITRFNNVISFKQKPWLSCILI